MKVLSLGIVGLGLIALVCGQQGAVGRADSGQPDATKVARIEIAPLPAAGPADSASTIRWVAPGDASWQAKELFSLSDKAGKPLAKGYAAVTDKDVLLKLVVNDAYQVNHGTGGTIWIGDSLTVSVDPLGEAMAKSPKAATYPGRAAAVIAFALTDRGPQAFALKHGRPARPAAMPELIATDTIVRDEPAKTTTYNVVLPWRELGVSAGASPSIGLAVAVRNQEGRKVDSYEWGHAMGDGSHPVIFHRLYLADPPGPVNSTTTVKDMISDDSRFGELRLATTDRGPLTIEASLQGQTKTFRAPAATADERLPRRFAVRGYPCLPPERPMVLTGRITADDKTLIAGDATLYRPVDIIDMLDRRLDALAARESKNKLFARHLKSLKAVVAARWVSDTLTFGPNSPEARQTVTYCKCVLDGLDGPAGQWQTYLDRRLPLCLAFTSRIDDTVQLYKVLLPPKWDPEKTYPMIVQLHGAGNSSPIYFWAKPLVDRPPQSPKDAYVPEAYVVMPWGRGNRGYRGVAEKDVFEAMAEANKQFKIDADRTYLWGHSMGGGGAWSIAMPLSRSLRGRGHQRRRQLEHPVDRPGRKRRWPAVSNLAWLERHRSVSLVRRENGEGTEEIWPERDGRADARGRA